MIDIIEHIKKLDESGNYRLADTLDNEVRKTYAQMQGQMPGVPSYSDFLLKQMIQNQMKPKPKETDTLSPTKNTDVATLRKQINKLISDGILQQKDIKNMKNNLNALPSLDGKIGLYSEKIDNLETDYNDHSNKISDQGNQIAMIEETIDTLK